MSSAIPTSDSALQLSRVGHPPRPLAPTFPPCWAGGGEWPHPATPTNERTVWPPWAPCLATRACPAESPPSHQDTTPSYPKTTPLPPAKSNMKWCRQWCRASRKGSHNGAIRLASNGYRSAPICRTKSKKGSPQLATRFGVVRRYAKRHNDFCSGGHGARTRNPLRGTTFPVCCGIDVRLWLVERCDEAFCWGA